MDNSISNQKAYVALSGGVDSAVSAALLKQQGYDVTGVFMKNWSGDDFGVQGDCPWKDDQKMAQLVADKLEIPFRSFNFEREYRAKVVEYFFSEYEAGRTPNPDVMCNKEIKFKLFLDKALAEGADLIATGHYVRKAEQNGAYQLLKGVDLNKDQSYFLHQITQQQLSRSLFPIGHLQKEEVRKLAFEFKLPNANRPDSQGICFIGEIDVQEFLRSRIETKVGEIKDIDTGEVVGQHDGVWFYTLGQREGLGIGGQEIPYFVVDKDADTNTLFVGHGGQHPQLMQSVVQLENLHLIDPDVDLSGARQLSASVRYRHEPQVGKFNIQELVFTFDKPQRAITSGQSLVLYDGDVCMGGGVIK